MLGEHETALATAASAATRAAEYLHATAAEKAARIHHRRPRLAAARTLTPLRAGRASLQGAKADQEANEPTPQIFVMARCKEPRCPKLDRSQTGFCAEHRPPGRQGRRVEGRRKERCRWRHRRFQEAEAAQKERQENRQASTQVKPEAARSYAATHFQGEMPHGLKRDLRRLCPERTSLVRLFAMNLVVSIIAVFVCCASAFADEPQHALPLAGRCSRFSTGVNGAVLAAAKATLAASNLPGTTPKRNPAFRAVEDESAKVEANAATVLSGLGPLVSADFGDPAVQKATDAVTLEGRAEFQEALSL